MSYIPNYKLATEKAIEVLEDSEITQAPIVLRNIIRRYSGDIKVVPYSKLMKRRGLSLCDLIDMFNSRMGACAYEPSTNHYIIFYNDALSTELCRFTVAHELGHIFLGHHIKAGIDVLPCTFVSNADYEGYEKEANAFGRNLLSPAPLALAVTENNYNDYEKCADLQSAFWISEKASSVRLSYINRDLRDYSDEMKSFVETIHVQK